MSRVWGFLFLCWLGLGSAFAERARIEFPSRVEIAAGRIYLGAIASISGDAPLVDRLQKLEVGRLELPGRETRLSIATLRTFFLSSVCSPDSLEIMGGPTLVVRSRAQKVERDSLRELLRAELAQRLDGQEGVDWILETPNLPASISVPEGELSWLIEFPASFDARGQESATLRVEQQGKTAMRYTLPFVVRRFAQVVRVVKPVARGMTVQRDHIAMQTVEQTHGRKQYVQSLDDALGRVALRSISRDQNLMDSWLERPWVVREGDQIRLVVRVGNSQFSTMGYARENGFVGQRILVENGDTRKRMQAEVRRAGEVELIL